MKIIDKILCKLSPTHLSKITKQWNELLVRSILAALPEDFSDLKKQADQIFAIYLSDWYAFPDYKGFVLSSTVQENTFEKFRKKGLNYKISGIEIFSKKTQKFESVDILIEHNLLSGFKITNAKYNYEEFDLDQIISKNVIRNHFEFPPDEGDLFYDSLGAEVKKLLRPDDLYEVSGLNNRTLYAFLDLEDGNCLAVDKKQNVYSLVHDIRPAVSKIKYSFLEILTAIADGKFDKEKHLAERCRNATRSA